MAGKNNAAKHNIHYSGYLFYYSTLNEVCVRDEFLVREFATSSCPGCDRAGLGQFKACVLVTRCFNGRIVLTAAAKQYSAISIKSKHRHKLVARERITTPKFYT